MMDRFPDCSWGLCSLPQSIRQPFPFRLSPREAYEYHYKGPGLFHKAPLSSIIRTGAFREAGGFSGRRMVGDTEMWHKLALSYNVLLMPEGIVWYREHDAQEVNSSLQFLKEYEAISIRYLTSEQCPMEPADVRAILRAKKRSLVWRTLRSAIKLNRKQTTANWQCLAAHYAQ
jgi:hypothetical protein